MGLEWRRRVTDGSYTCGKHRVTQLSNHYVVQNEYNIVYQLYFNLKKEEKRTSWL